MRRAYILVKENMPWILFQKPNFLGLSLLLLQLNKTTNWLQLLGLLCFSRSVSQTCWPFDLPYDYQTEDRLLCAYFCLIMHQPRTKHWDAALCVVRYLKSSPGQGTFLSSTSSLCLTAFCDADWAGCPLTRHSVAGYFIFLGNSPIS